MKAKIIILALVIATTIAASVTGVSCDCTELSQQADCLLQSGCLWSNSKCSTADCTTYNDQTNCDNASGCAWTNAGACKTFTQCSDYTVANSTLCSQKNPICIAGAINGTTYPCAAQNVTSCATITDSATCTALGCGYSTACATTNCANLTSTACTLVQSATFGTMNICAVNNNACADLTDTTTLNATTCYKQTYGTWAWNSTNCTACTGKPVSSNGLLFAFLGLVNVLLL